MKSFTLKFALTFLLGVGLASAAVAQKIGGTVKDSAGKPVVGDFCDAAVLHIAAKQPRQHRTDLRFSFAAVTLNHHHALSLVAGNQAIANKLL